MDKQNLFAGLALTPAADERFESLLARPGLRIERIVSSGQASAPGFWYDQAEAEWVVLLTGAAGLRFADEGSDGDNGGDGGARTLVPGDWLYIAPHRRHRVEWTAPHEPTVWLAVHFAE